ncbi:MAG TPA: tetratricopeptide repeat protein [Acidimicrobiales bacterium]|nr:tetratricopeptide repeat protein [Acidimicrobiales bacterium]
MPPQGQGGPARRDAPDQWIDEGPVRHEAERAVRRGGAPQPRRADPVDLDVGAAELGRAVGPGRQAKVESRLRDAARAFERERFTDARRILKPLAEMAPASLAVRELYGLTLYRLGRWNEAAAELEVVRELGGTTEQHPVLADCYRALRRYADVDELWEELRAASPSAELVTEGRIVAAGALADRGRLDDAITELGRGFRLPKRPQVHHLRRAYALADLHERVGDLPHARGLFERVAAVDPDFADVTDRVRALR